MHLNYGFYNSPYGRCCLAFTEKGLSVLIFTEKIEQAVAELQQRFPKAVCALDNHHAEVLGKRVFHTKEPVELLPEGTPFQQAVWRTLMAIPQGATSTYKEIAVTIGRPKAFRAVGTAVGANPIAYLIPCHRVIRSDGKIGGYRWGVERKAQMLMAEGVTVMTQ